MLRKKKPMLFPLHGIKFVSLLFLFSFTPKNTNYLKISNKNLPRGTLYSKEKFIITIIFIIRGCKKNNIGNKVHIISILSTPPFPRGECQDSGMAIRRLHFHY